MKLKPEWPREDYKGVLLSELCWDSKHRSCNSANCWCPCHEPKTKRVKRDYSEQVNIVDVAGTIEIK